MIPQLKGIKPLSRGNGGKGRIARLEQTVDLLVKFLSAIEEGDGIKLVPTKDNNSIKITADTDANALPVGTENYQVLVWSEDQQKWTAGWVTAIDPDAQQQKPSSDEYKPSEGEGDEGQILME